MSPRIRRCAVYTRKSSEEGLEQDFNSLHAQREACEAFIRSQKSEGWRLIETPYDDGGLSGGTMERPALQRLLQDIQTGKVDTVVVYKVDRLTRSLADFAKMVELFDAHEVSFVAVTQQFNTTTSMGRLTLNILLSFAQFEREVTGERIRDKIAASKRKGMWMGGNVPLGYDTKDRKLTINEREAETVRQIYRRYLELGCVRRLKEELDKQGIRSKTRTKPDGTQSGGSPFSRGALYTLLANPIYIGEVRHKGVRHLGQHEAIVEKDLWEQVQARLRSNGVDRPSGSRQTGISPLAGKLFDENGERLTPSHAVKNGRRYCYYVSRALLDGTAKQAESGWRLPAREIKNVVAMAAKRILVDRAAVAEALRASEVAAREIPAVLEAAIRAADRISGGNNALDLLKDFIDSVELKRDSIQITLNLLPLFDKDHRFAASLRPIVSHSIPVQMKQRGVELRLIIGDAARESRKVDDVLIKAIARSVQWADDLISGRASSIVELAKRNGVATQYVGHLLPLAFLAPEIVKAIVEGRQPVHLTAEALTNRLGLPHEWTAQKQALGFS